MSWRPVAALVVGALLMISACDSGSRGASQRPPTVGPAGTPVATASTAASASPGASVCRQTGDPGVIAVSIADFEFKPASIGAKVGQVVAFTSTGFEPHNATVEGNCGTRTLQTGESDGLVFTAPGSYKFGCTVHAWMSGTFTIAP